MPEKSDAQYAIEEDARILIESEYIKKDSKRLSAARGQIKKDMIAAKAVVGSRT